MMIANEMWMDYSELKHMLKGFRAVNFLDLTLLSNQSGLLCYQLMLDMEQFNLTNILGSSAIYTLLLVVVAIISKKSMNLPLNLIGESDLELYKKFNIGSILFAVEQYSSPMDMSASLFKLGFLKEEIFYSMDKSSVYVYLGVLISAIVLFISGRNMAKKYGSDIKNILYTSLSYAAIATLFSFIIKISFSINGSVLFFSADDLGSARVAFNFLSVLFGTFIMSGFFMLLGSKISGDHE